MEKNTSQNIVTTEENSPFPITPVLLITVMILGLAVLGLKLMGVF